MHRRGFLSALAALSATAVLDPEYLLWKPGARTYFLPTETDRLFGRVVFHPDYITIPPGVSVMFDRTHDVWYPVCRVKNGGHVPIFLYPGSPMDEMVVTHVERTPVDGYIHAKDIASSNAAMRRGADISVYGQTGIAAEIPWSGRVARSKETGRLLALMENPRAHQRPRIEAGVFVASES